MQKNIKYLISLDHIRIPLEYDITFININLLLSSA